MSLLPNLNFETMTPAEFSDHLPELIASSQGSLFDNPQLTSFFAANPDAAALVRDLEAIATAAKELFEPEAEVEPSDDVWSNIASKLGQPDPSEV
ncbi:MAG: hypothetical protein PW735_04490 [Acidobacteriaceae bacterium]|nr:hypothetical protein [Acidobacteriaceae bacterium]